VERSYLVSAPRADVAKLRALFAELAARAQRFLGDAGFAPDAITKRPQLNLRYPGQNWSLAIDVDLVATDGALRDAAIEAFHRRHEAEYGHARRGEEPEITGVRLVSSAETPRPAFASGFTAARRIAAPLTTRRANLGRGFEDVAIHRGAALAPGDVVASPAIVEETYTTIAIYPGWELRVDDAGDYLMARGARPAG
jgi:N-methylhydantoinase A